MRLGFTLPQFGDHATPDGIREVAVQAEALGYDSLWVSERLLYPVAPKSPYPAVPDGRLPREYQRIFEPLTVLTFAAACTHRIALGTSVLVLPYYNPVLLARQVATLDVLSGGRVRLGLGTGWSPDEFDATGTDIKTRGARTLEALDLLRKIWTLDAPEHKGAHYMLPRSMIALRPVQTPHPPIYMAAFNDATMRRVAEHADGWNPAGIPIPAMKTFFSRIQEMAQAAGRDPARLELVVRANLVLAEGLDGKRRRPFTGTWDQIRDDIAATRDVGAHQLLFEGQFLPGHQGKAAALDLLRKLRDLAG